MKIKRYFAIYAICAGLLAACKDEPVEIITLGRGGDTFYFGEKVEVWAGVNGDLSKINYDWSCTGGGFDDDKLKNLYQNLWIAPDSPGNYTVKVTAETKNNSDTRETEMKVVNYFREDFLNLKNPGGWVSTNTTLAWNEKINGKAVGLLVPSTSTSDPNIRRSMSAIPLFPPFSVQTKMGYTKYKPVTNVTSGNGATYISLFFTQPMPNKRFIREIRWEFCPPASGSNDNWRLRMENYDPTRAVSDFSTSAGTNNPNPEPFITGAIQGRDERFRFDAGTDHTFTVTIDADLYFTACVDGAVWIDKSPAIRNFFNDNGIALDALLVSEFRVTCPRLSASNAGAGQTTWYFSDVIINDKNTAIGGDVNNIGFEELK